MFEGDARQGGGVRVGECAQGRGREAVKRSVQWRSSSGGRNGTACEARLCSSGWDCSAPGLTLHRTPLGSRYNFLRFQAGCCLQGKPARTSLASTRSPTELPPPPLRLARGPGVFDLPRSCDAWPSLRAAKDLVFRGTASTTEPTRVDFFVPLARALVALLPSPPSRPPGHELRTIYDFLPFTSY